MTKRKTWEGADLGRPPVSVVIPQVKLQLRDLAYLRSVAQPNGGKCSVPHAVIDRLRFLDLIAQAKVAPTEEVVRECAKDTADEVRKLQMAIAEENWDIAISILHELRRAKDRLQPIVQDVLTDRGKKLLKDGEVKVRARKVGCV